MVFYIVPIVVFLILILWVISTKNRFIRLKVKIEEASSSIDVALTKRYDILTKMVETTKGYMNYEKETLLSIVSARNSKRGIEDNQKFDAELNKVAGSLNAVFEQYPELKSNETVQNLQESINEVEDNLSASRRLYNSNVSIFNQSIKVFPAKLLAGGYQDYPFFEVEEAKKKDVDVSL